MCASYFFFRRFQWVHLNERLAYERISMKMKLRTEISAAKRESNFFSKNVDLSKKLKMKGIIGGTKKTSSTQELPASDSRMDTSESKSKDQSSFDPKPSSSKSYERPAPKGAATDRSAFFKTLMSR